MKLAAVHDWLKLRALELLHRAMREIVAYRTIVVVVAKSGE
jgi:hypothetical protein